ncbi:hypothetical protein [Lacimonas salitolerans]|uniref:Uncharacterized protein n=1 Tax=Lacimonas salitolerans TaxID=1323750 RepID=A0ABW4EDF9_9RHOB
MRTMSMVPPASRGDENETVSENAEHVRSESKEPPTRADGSPKKSAAAVQAVVAEEQRQMEMEMDFEGPLPLDSPAKSDQAQVQAALNSLEDLQSTMRNQKVGSCACGAIIGLSIASCSMKKSILDCILRAKYTQFNSNFCHIF